jgi:hypothetical protein
VAQKVGYITNYKPVFYTKGFIKNFEKEINNIEVPLLPLSHAKENKAYVVLTLSSLLNNAQLRVQNRKNEEIKVEKRGLYIHYCEVDLEAIYSSS